MPDQTLPPWFSATFAADIAHRKHFFQLYKRN